MAINKYAWGTGQKVPECQLNLFMIQFSPLPLGPRRYHSFFQAILCKYNFFIFISHVSILGNQIILYFSSVDI